MKKHIFVLCLACLVILILSVPAIAKSPVMPEGRPAAQEAPTPVPQRISFASGASSAQVQASIGPNDMERFVINAMKGQTMIVKITPDDPQNPDVILIIWGKDGTVLISDHAGATSWSGPLPSTQDYYIDVRSVVQTPTQFTLDVTIPPTPAPVPTIVPQRISFASGASSAQVQASIGPNDMERFVINAMKGQTMIVKITPDDPQDPDVILIIWGKDGTVLISDHAGATSWSGPLPSTQDYYIDVRSVVQTSTQFTLDVSIPPLPVPAPTPVPQRISFASGATSAQEQGSLAPGEIAQFVIKAMQGQVLIVKVMPGSVQNPDVVLVIWGQDGTVLLSDHAGATSWSGPLPSTQDYYIETVSVVQAPTQFTLDVTIPPPAK